MPNPMSQNFSRKQKRRGSYESVEEQYKKLTHRMLKSEAWRHLKGNDIKVYLEICRRYNGRNNGEIFMSRNEAVRLLHIGTGSAQAAFKRLEQMGFIKVSKKGSFKGRQASCFILTDKSYKGHNPTNEWASWQPPKKPKKLDIGIETIREALDEEVKSRGK
jgi:hypothetical protein